MAEIVLHGFWRSSCTHRVQLALRLKDIDFEYRSVHLGRREQEEPAFRAISPAGQVPVLEMGGRRLTQSLAIIVWLQARFPGRGPVLVPEQPEQRAQAWEIAERINSFVQPFQLPGGVKRPLVRQLGLDPEAAASRLKAFSTGLIDDSLALLDHHVEQGKSGRYCVGDSVTIADLVLIPQLDGAERLGCDVARHATLSRIREACMSLQAFQDADPRRQPDAPTVREGLAP